MTHSFHQWSLILDLEDIIQWFAWISELHLILQSFQQASELEVEL